MAHKRTTKPVPDEPAQSHGDEQEQEQETVHTTEHKRAFEETLRFNEDRLQTTLQRADASYVQLEHTKSQLRAIIDASQEAMLFLSSDGRPLKVNTCFTTFFGLDDTTVLSQSADQLKELLKKLFVDTVLLERSLTRGAMYQEHIFREQQVQVGTERREFDFSSLPVMNVDETYIGRLYVWRDATYEREVDRVKSGFVSMVSHELRTPLTSIKGYIDLILTDETVGELTELQREFLEIVRNNSRRLESLVNDLLDISRMESGKIDLHRKPLDITLLIRKLLPSFQPGWDARRQTFTLHLPEKAPRVLGDAERVTQILSNLLSNAHKYTPDEGHIDLSVEITEPVARVEVTDNGIGLSKEEQALLFTPFYRAHNPTTEEVGGTGLGLMITRSLVEMQGGEIQVSSKPGHGSTFGFTLPLAQVLEPSTFSQESLLGKRILVVDDEKETRHLLRSYLQGAGYEVMTAPNAMTAFQLARTARPDLITLDMLLPNNAGLPILELLKSDAITASIPVILLTVVNNDGQRRLLGATDYLVKPIEASDLLQRITTVFADQTHRLILLVAPKSKSLELLASALREVGHRVTFVPDGQELLALVKRAHPDLIILDASVPPRGGLVLLQALRTDLATHNLPVIISGIQPGELSMHWHTLTPIGYVDIWGNPSHVNAIVDVITQRLKTGTDDSVSMLPA